jgi:pyruvate dehydrogenase E2 component (dihydrolipoamide acetyltransferase)
MAKRLAEQRNIRLQGKGTGLFGSITSSDLEGMAAAVRPAAAGAAPPAAPANVPSGAPHIDIPVSGMRATIAKRLLQSKQNVPHYYLSIECNVDKLLKLRSRFNKQLEKEKVKLSVNDFIVKAVALACKKVPEANSAWMDSVIRQ